MGKSTYKVKEILEGISPTTSKKGTAVLRSSQLKFKSRSSNRDHQKPSHFMTQLKDKNHLTWNGRNGQIHQNKWDL